MQRSPPSSRRCELVFPIQDELRAGVVGADLHALGKLSCEGLRRGSSYVVKLRTIAANSASGYRGSGVFPVPSVTLSQFLLVKILSVFAFCIFAPISVATLSASA